MKSAAVQANSLKKGELPSVFLASVVIVSAFLHR
ncbi:hypothetical protein Pvag_0312 [Pantoea vagans C9-1]|nr:hypothetical protein Pvag_0312 [Pantoea vagans C9-1]